MSIARCLLLGAVILALGCGEKTPPKQAQKIEWIVGLAGPIAPLVAAELKSARQAGRRLLVYTGASWCDPCRRFHDAVLSGALDAQFGSLRIIDFDYDRDRERLAEAGYTPKLIPLLAIPGDDGRNSGKQMEGSNSGDGAVAQMIPRLLALVAETRPER